MNYKQLLLISGVYLPTGIESEIPEGVPKSFSEQISGDIFRRIPETFTRGISEEIPE